MSSDNYTDFKGRLEYVVKNSESPQRKEQALTEVHRRYEYNADRVRDGILDHHNGWLNHKALSSEFCKRNLDKDWDDFLHLVNNT